MMIALAFNLALVVLAADPDELPLGFTPDGQFVVLSVGEVTGMGSETTTKVVNLASEVTADYRDHYQSLVNPTLRGSATWSADGQYLIVTVEFASPSDRLEYAGTSATPDLVFRLDANEHDQPWAVAAPRLLEAMHTLDPVSAAGGAGLNDSDQGHQPAEQRHAARVDEAQLELHQGGRARQRHRGGTKPDQREANGPGLASVAFVHAGLGETPETASRVTPIFARAME